MTEELKQESTKQDGTTKTPIDHYRDLSDFSRSEIQWIRSAYKLAAALVAVVFVVGIGVTYKSSSDFKKELREDIERWGKVLQTEMKYELDSQIAKLAKQVESRVDEEFKKGNIQSLVQQKAQERIDEFANNIINKQITQILNPKLVEIDGRLSSLKQELARVGSELKKLESVALKELPEISNYIMTVVAAQNEDRPAFDQLQEWAKDQDSPFRVKAQQAWQKILDDHATPFFVSGHTVPWKEGVDPSKLGINELRNNYELAPPHVRLALVEYIWKRTDLPKKERMQFIVEVLQQDENLKVVEYAARYFIEVSGQKIKPLAVTGLLDWWDENKDTIQ